MTLPVRRRRQGLGEGLSQEHRRPEIDVEVRLPGLGIESREPVPIETGGVVDQAGRRPQRFGASLDQGRERLQPGEIGGERRRHPALAHDLGDERQGFFGRIPVMDADPPSPSREIQSNAARRAGAPRRSRERSRDPRLEPCRLWKTALANRIAKRNLRVGATLSEPLSPNKAERDALQL